MPALTPCAALPYPVPSDPPDVAGDMKKLAEAVDDRLCEIRPKPLGEVYSFWDMGKGYPPNSLVCDGSTFSPSSYPELNAYLGGNQLPDLRGRFLMGANSTYPVRTFGGFANSVNVEHDHGLGTHTHTMLHNHTATAANDTHGHTDGTLAAANSAGHDHNVGAGSSLVFSSPGGIGGIPLSGSPNVHSTGPWTVTGADGGVHTHAITGTVANDTHTHTLTVNNSTVGTGGPNSGSRTTVEGSDGAERNRPPFATVTHLMQAR
jgi:Phage Tail Collar Domain